MFLHCRNLKKAEDKVKSLLEEIEENKQDIVNLEKELGKLEEEATNVMEAYQESQVCVFLYFFLHFILPPSEGNGRVYSISQ